MSKIQFESGTAEKLLMELSKGDEDNSDGLVVTDNEDDEEVQSKTNKKGTAAKKQGNAEKKKLKNKRVKDEMREWITDNKSEVKKMRKIAKNPKSSFNLESVHVLKKELMRHHKKKEEDVQLTHILPLFVFLKKTSLILEQIGVFDGIYKGKTIAGEERVAEFEKICSMDAEEEDDEDEDMKVTMGENELKAISKKYGKKWWKLPSYGAKKGVFLRPFENPRKFEGKRKVRVTLMDVHANLAEVKDGQGVKEMVFITPVLNYEYV